MMNAVFRTIDLAALVISPAVAGIIFDFINEVTTAVVIGTWNVVSVFMEYYLLVLIYQDFPDLSKPKLTEQRYVLVLSSFHVIVNYTFKISYRSQSVKLIIFILIALRMKNQKQMHYHFVIMYAAA